MTIYAGKNLMLVASLLIAGSLRAQVATNSTTLTIPPSPLIWDPTNLSHTVKQGEVGAHFVFKVKNTSATETVIEDVETSCGCTVAPIPSRPWRLAPHETNKLDVVVDLREKNGSLSPSGAYQKEVYVRTSTGATNLLMISVTFPEGLTNDMTAAQAARIWGQQLAAVDHQAVFKTDCVKCHFVPAYGKSGENLFHAVCGICHEAKDRARGVPDLTRLKSEIGTNYWRGWITDGKAGTWMPGFAATNGGPLDDAQINSLIQYLTNALPRPLKAAELPKPEK